ncbi:MAG: competence/damage-inducible protein A [Ignavibacteria bacterium]
MKAKLITVGDEILIGQIVNTNAAFIGDRLFSIGIPLEKTVVIGDDESIMLQEFEDSLKNYDVTIITGGLGPTHDDITKPALVKFFNDELVTDEKVLAYVKNIFSSRNLPMPESNNGQALVPKNSKVIWNSNGTAPGIWIERDNKVFIAMPGVPFEMKGMVENEVLKMLRNKFSWSINTFLMQKTLQTTGLGESTLHEMIGDVNEIVGENKLAFLPSTAGVRLRINVKGNSEAEAKNKLKEIESKIREKIETYIFGTNDDELEKVIGNILAERKQTLSVAESCTGGRISSKIVSVPGSSRYYIGGACVYSNKEKFDLLNVSRETIEKYGAVSEQTAIEMAEGIRSLMETDYALSTTGIAGPTGGTEEKPVGLVWIGFSSKEKKYALKFLFGNRRDINIERSSQRALEVLRRELLKIEIKF